MCSDRATARSPRGSARGARTLSGGATQGTDRDREEGAALRERHSGPSRIAQGPSPGQSQVKADESACTPGSVSPSPRGGGGGGHPSGAGVATGLVRSTRGLGRAALVHPRRVAYAAPLDLAPDGVYLAAQVALGAGGLLHHRFTLTGCRTGTAPAVCFLWHCPAGHPGWALPTILPCGARTFLGGPTRGGSDATARPARPPCRPWYPRHGGRRPGCPERQPKARRYACGLTPVTRRKRSRNAVAEPRPTWVPTRSTG